MTPQCAVCSLSGGLWRVRRGGRGPQVCLCVTRQHLKTTAPTMKPLQSLISPRTTKERLESLALPPEFFVTKPWEREEWRQEPEQASVAEREKGEIQRFLKRTVYLIADEMPYNVAAIITGCKSENKSYRCRILIWSLFCCWECFCTAGNANL